MKLIFECPNCKKDITDEKERCPNCGEIIPKKQSKFRWSCWFCILLNRDSSCRKRCKNSILNYRHPDFKGET
jgi:hypothetical protein